MPEGAVGWAAHGIGEVAAAEAARFEPRAEFVKAERVGREREIVGFDDEQARLRERGGGAFKDGDFVTVGVEFDGERAGETTRRNRAVDGFDGHSAGIDGAGHSDAAAVEQRIDEKGNGAGLAAGGGGDGIEAVAAFQRPERGLMFSERLEKEELRLREMAARAARPDAVGGADVDPGADVGAAGGGAGKQAVHLEGALAAQEVQTEGIQDAVGSTREFLFPRFSHECEKEIGRFSCAGSGRLKPRPTRGSATRGNAGGAR